jgi:hypothetical protein
MGTYNYTDSQTGKTYTFEYGGDAPTNEDWGAMSQIINADRDRINQMSMDVLGRPLTPEDDRMAFRRGLDIGATSAYGALGTAARSAGEGIGIDFLRNLGTRMEQSARGEQLREATQMPAPTRLADVEGVGDFLTFVGEGAGQTVPEMVATIGGGLAGGLFGGAPGFVAGSTAVGTPFFFGRNIQRQEQQVELGQLAEVDRTAAFLTAVPQAALNSSADKILLTGRALGLSIPASQNLFVRVGQQGAAGAVVEAPTEIAQQMMERAQAGLPLDSEDAIAEYVEAGVLGGIIGAGVGGGLGAFRGPEAPAAPPAPPGATPPAAGPASAPTVPPAGPATPPVPPVAPPAPATVVNTRTVTVGGGPALLVTLSNGQVLALPASATQADIDAAVRQYNSAQKQIIPPAGPSVPPTQAPPAVPPVATQPTPGLTAQEEADVEAELQTGTPVEQTQALLRSLLGPRLRPNMYKKLETLGVGPDDPVVLSELEAYIPVYQRNQRLMEVDPGLPARLRRYIDETRARQAAEAASGQTQATAPTQGAQPAPSVETQPAASPEFVLEPAEPDGRGAGVPDYTPLTEAEAFEAAAELAAAARAAKPRPVGGTVAPTPAAPSGTATQPGALDTAIPPGPALWASKDFDLPVEVLNQPPQAAPDGRRYQAIRDPATGVNSFVPLDELRMLGEPQTFNDLAVEQSTPPAAPLAPDTALRIRRQLRDAGIDPIDFVPLESQARLEQEYDQERARFEQQYAIRPDQRGAPYLRTPVDQWTGYDWFTARQEMPQETAALNAAFIARERGRAPMLDRLNNLAYELRQVAPELDEAISQDPLAVMNAALADRGIPEIEPMFRPQQGREAQPQTFNDLAVEQSTPPASSIALDPAYSQEAAEYAVRWAAIRAGIPQTPELLAEAANTLVAKGGNPVEVLESLYMPFDAPSDPRLQGVDPFGLAEEAIESVKARTLPPGAQVLVQGQRTPAGIIPRTPTFAEPDADLTEAERALGAAFERAVVPGPDVAPVVEPTQADIEALAAADRTLRTAWETRNPNLTEEMRAFIFPEDAVADPSTVEDRQTVRGLFLRGQKGQAKSAETIFGKYPTVVQGLDHIAELQSRDKNLTKIIDNKALDSETLVDPETDTALDYGNALDFFEQGIVGNTGANAAKWVKANLSPEANYYLRARIEQLKASEEAIKKRTTLDDPVAIADKGVNQQVSEFEQTYRDDLGQAATAPFMDINGATQRAAMGVAEDSKPVAMPDLPTNVTATEQELAAARTGLRLPPSRMRGWTGLEIAVAQNFEGITTRKQAQAKIDELSDADIAQMIEDRAVTNRFLGLFRRFKTVRQAAILDVPVPFMVRAALMNNNLKASILHIARTAADAEIRAIARTISANLANTNVQLVDPADPANRLEARAYGAYDPETDTVLLPNTGDITIQTLLHETGHAVTAAYIETNPNSAEVNALKALFSTAYTQVMPHMSSVAYREGGVTPTPEEVTLTEVKEFVVEIKSNMEMRNTLRRLALDDLRVPQKGVLLNALEWVNSVFRKIMRTLARRGPGPNALQGADFVINSIMTPQRAAGDVLFSRGARPGTGVSPLMAVVRPLRDTAMNPSTRQKYADDASTFLDTTNTIGARTLLGFLPPLAVGDIAAKVGVKDPYRMFELIQRRDGMFSRAAQTVDTMLSRLTGYYQQQQAEKRAFDTLTTDSTVENMDPSVDPTVPAVQDRNYTKFWLAFDVLDQGGNILRTERRWFDSPADRDNAIIRLNAKTPATRTRARMAGDARTPGELQTLQALKDRFNALSPEGQTMYRQLRDFYEARYDELWKVLQGQMDAILGTDPRTAAEAKQSLYVKLFDKGQIRPYFPLVREGDYWLEFSAFNAATNSTEVVKMSFETRGARDRMIAQLATAPEVQKDAAGVPIINQYMASDMAQTSFRTDALFVKNIMDVFDKFNASAQPNNKISDEVMNDIAALIVKAAPEGSMARQLHKRNNTPGYIEDAEVALHNKGYRLANAAARQVSSFAIRKQAQEYREAIAKNPSRSQQLVMEELIKSGDNALAPMDSPIERAAQAANRIAYGYTLLGNVSSFIVNLSSMANVIFPQLGGRYGFNKATSELTRASRLFLSSGTKRIVRRDGVDTKLSALPSIDNYYVMEENGDYVVRTDIQMDAAKRQRLERMAPLLKQMSERGMLHHSLFYDSLGLQDFAEGRSRSDKAYAFFGAPFHVVERMNRQATAIAAYELELQRLTTENAAAANPRTQAELQVEAANEAVYRTTEMNGGASLNTAPRFTQRGLMRVAMMYKSYGMTVTTLLFKTARQIVNNIYGSTPEMKAERDIAMRQMMGHLGITFLLAGAHGLPMFGLASVIYNMFKDDEELSFDEVVRLQTSEMFYKGPVNALTGFEISERVGLSELLYRANRYNSDPSAEETIVQLLGGPAWSTFSGIKRGLNDMREGEYYRGFESMLPLMVSNPMRAARFYFEGGVQTRGDNFIYEDLTSSELIGRALGFNSAELVRRQDRSSEMVRIGKGVQEKRTKLVERLFLARRAGDDEAAERAIQDIIEFNQTVGARFPPAVISSADVESSFDRRIDTIQEMVNGVSINPQVRDILALEYNAIQDGLTRY